jgi:hypothetical protein
LIKFIAISAPKVVTVLELAAFVLALLHGGSIDQLDSPSTASCLLLFFTLITQLVALLCNWFTLQIQLKVLFRCQARFYDST